MSLLQHSPSVANRESLAYYLDFSNKRSFKFPQRIYDYGVWADGQQGTISPFGYTGNSFHNNRVISDDPWGNQSVVWESHNEDGSSANGGIIMDYVDIDPTKMYRMSWWERRVYNSPDLVYSGHYNGLHVQGSENSEVTHKTTGGTTSNFYFWSQTPLPTSLPIGEWVLIVGHVWPIGSDVGPNHPDSGLYTINGRIGNISRDAILLPGTTHMRPRSLTVYRTSNTDNTGTAIHHSFAPRMDVIDGNEPTISDLLNNNTDKAFNLMNPSNEAVLINGPIFKDKGLKFDGINDYVMTDFGEGIDLGVEELTVDVWVKVNSLTGNKTIFSSDFVTDRRFYLITVGDTVRLGVQDSDINNEIGAPITTDWMNLVVTFNPYSKLVKVYKDGEYTGYSRGHTGYIIPSDILLGRYTTSVPWWLDGSIGLFRVWNKLLSDSEIKTNFEQFRSRYGV